MPIVRNLKYLVISGIFVFISISLIRSTLDVLGSSKRLTDSNTELARMESKKTQLERDIEYKKTDEYIEERARNDLNLIKPGEKAYVLVYSDPDNKKELEGLNVLGDSTKNTPKTSDRKDDDKDPGTQDSSWYKWYKLFF